METLVGIVDRMTVMARSIFSLHEETRSHVGDYKWSCRSNDFQGWLLCDGRALSCEEYKDLFEIIGTSFGTAGSNTFYLPDNRGRVLAAIGTDSNQFFGSATGAETLTLTTSNLPAHIHTGVADADGEHTHSITVDSAGAHTHTTNAVGGNVGLAVADGNNTVIDTDASGGELNVWTLPRALTVNTAGAHTHVASAGSNGLHVHTFVTDATGAGEAFSVMQPTLFGGNLFIYAGRPTPPSIVFFPE